MPIEGDADHSARRNPPGRDEVIRVLISWNQRVVGRRFAIHPMTGSVLCLGKGIRGFPGNRRSEFSSLATSFVVAVPLKLYPRRKLLFIPSISPLRDGNGWPKRKGFLHDGGQVW